MLTRQEKTDAAAALVGVLCAFCSDRRMGLGEGNCDSGSNMARLAPSICALDTCDGSIHDMIVACVRRILSLETVDQLIPKPNPSVLKYASVESQFRLQTAASPSTIKKKSLDVAKV